MTRVTLLGGPAAGQTGDVPHGIDYLNVNGLPGRYVRAFVYDGPPPTVPNVDRWAPKPRRNPFTAAKRRGNIFPSNP